MLHAAATKAMGAWVYWLVPGGACVAMRLIDEGPYASRKELRLSRRGIATPDLALWDAEVTIFQRYLHCVGWTRDQREMIAEPGAATYRAVTTVREPPAGGQPTVCARCGTPVVHEPAYAQDLCAACATALGTEEAAARRREGTRP